MEGNDLNFLSASSASIHATSHILPLSTTYPSITPKYTLIDSSEPSKQQSQSLNNNTGNQNNFFQKLVDLINVYPTLNIRLNKYFDNNHLS